MRIDLTGVPETLLWNLYQRGAEAGRPGGVLKDPQAVQLVATIDYPFAKKFGAATFSQWQALRARRFDLEVERFLRTHPDGTVVALGEGLETQFWRVDNGTVTWLTVELPETAEVRDALLPEGPDRRRTFAGSALEPAWMDEVDPARGLLITAQGLLMYFDPEDVHRLIADCATRFPGASFLFDGVPQWFSDRTKVGEMKTPTGYTTPPMPWALTAAEQRRLKARALRPPRGRGFRYAWLYPLLNLVPPIRRLGVTGLPIARIDFR